MLKYLFTATFSDGSTVVQNSDDRSTIEPDTRSCFYDVCEKEKEVSLIKFEIAGEGHVYSVDLTTGHFEVDAVPFFLHEEALSGFRLIYYRCHTHNFKVGEDTVPDETSHSISFRLGWQCTVNGKNYQHIMQVN